MACVNVSHLLWNQAIAPICILRVIYKAIIAMIRAETNIRMGIRWYSNTIKVFGYTMKDFPALILANFAEFKGILVL